MKSFLANWKTTATGAGMVLAGILSVFGIKVPGMTVDPSTAGPLILTGFGLLFAKDGNVTGGDTKQTL